MDLTSPKYFGAPSFLASHGEAPLEGNTSFYKKTTKNPFSDTFPDPLCKLNLKETSEFVKSFPMANRGTETRPNYLDVSAQRKREGGVSVTKRNAFDAPSTPGRPIFSFRADNFSRKTFPSKWDDAEKWLNNSSSSCYDSPTHCHGLSSKTLEPSKISKQCEGLRPQDEVFAEKSRVVTEEKVSKAVSSIHGSVPLELHVSARDFNGVLTSADVLLKDKYTNEVEPIFPKYRCLGSMKEGFLFGSMENKSMKPADMEVFHEVKHREIGTAMTPLGSSTTSRCHTPFKSTSPARHNTPASRSGPFALVNSNNTAAAATIIDITQLQECHLAKLCNGTQFDSVVSTWSSRAEEEEDISKSLRHFEIGNECRKSVSDPSRACTWEEDENNKRCLRCHREEAKIQAWLNLQSAKAEAQSRKLEVKIQRMRSDLEEKLMKRMAVVHRKAKEWRMEARIQHSEQIQRVTKQVQKMVHRRSSHFNNHSSCGCFPCNNHLL